eukprot:2431477-Pyramimonas_sp.AAC.1
MWRGGADQQTCCPPPHQDGPQLRPGHKLRPRRREPAESRGEMHPTKLAPSGHHGPRMPACRSLGYV